MTIAVNGRFLAARPTGVQRVAMELVSRISRRVPTTLRVPRGCPVPEALRGSTAVVEGRLAGRGWEQLELPSQAGPAELQLDPANAGPLWGGRRVLLLHDVLPLSDPDAYTPAFRLWFRHVVARSARRAARVVMFSEWARAEAIRRIGLDAERVVVVGQGVEPFDRPASADAVCATLRRHGIEPPFILGLGAGDPRKNSGFLVEVVRGLEPDGAAPALVLVGAAYPHVQGHGGDAGASRPPRIHRLGHVTDDELHALYTAARVFCFPSRAEGFGRPPLEAMGCGTPALVGDYGCAAEVVGGAAAILPPDIDAWRRALRPLLADDDAAAEASRRSHQHAARFRWDPVVDRLLAAFRAATAGA